MDAVTGLSIAGRTGINDLWFREPKKGAEGDDLAVHVISADCGPCSETLVFRQPEA